MSRPDHIKLLEQTAEIVSAYVSNNSIITVDLVGMIGGVFQTLEGLGGASVAYSARPKNMMPAHPIGKSVTPEFIYSLEDGKPYQSLKRHLMAKYGLTPEAYREKWKLPHDYPMVAPAYAKRRSEIAKDTHFGKNHRVRQR